MNSRLLSRRGALTAFLGGLVTADAARAQGLDPTRGVYTLADVIEPALRSVVQILNFGGERADQPRSSGSGAVIDADQGLVLTNLHVIDQARTLKVALPDGRVLDAQLVGSDAATDLALLRAANLRAPALTIADSGALRIGDVVIAVGYPFGLEQTVTSGIVSGLRRTGIGTQLEDFIQTDASINSGNSGGPLLDSRGRLIGVNTAIYSRSGGNVGIGFAVPSRIVEAIVAQLRQGGAVRRGVIGISLADPAPGADGRRGARVVQVEPGSSAAGAGVRPDDLVVSANGESVRQSADLRRIVGLLAPGRTVVLEVDRGGVRQNLPVAVRPAPATVASVDAGGAAPGFGAQLAEIGREHPLFGLVQGVAITGVRQGGPLAQRGVQAGDVITQVNQTRVRTLAEFRNALSRAPGRKTLVIARGNALAPITID